MADWLVIDYKIDKLIRKIASTTKDAKGEFLTYDAVVEIIEAQLRATVDGMAEGNTIIWKYFGTFVATKRRVDMLNKRREREGRIPTLVDTGLVRVSFKRNGDKIGETDLFFPQSKKDVLEPPILKIEKNEEDN